MKLSYSRASGILAKERYIVKGYLVTILRHWLSLEVFTDINDLPINIAECLNNLTNKEALERGNNNGLMTAAENGREFCGLR